MTFRRSALSFLLALCLAPGAALAQDRTASAMAFGGTSMNTFSSTPKIDFGVNVGKELTPNIQALGEFGRVGNMLPTLSAGLLSAVTPYDVSVSAFYGEGGIRLLAAPGSGMNPYVEATGGIARLTPHVSGFGSSAAAISLGLGFLHSTEPILGVGGGLLMQGGPVVADVGYRYKQVADDVFANVLAGGQKLRAHQVRFGIGVRF